MIVIYTPKVTNRIKYTLDFVFQHYFGIVYRITENQDFVFNDNDIYINYSNTLIPNTYHIFQYSLLLETTIQAQQPIVSRATTLPVFFQTTANYDLPYDIFSCIFYLISRYEEYLPHEKDIHGRYLSSNSILSHPDFNFSPIVEYWLLDFKKILLQLKPTLPFKEYTFAWISTFDIDNAFQYLGRNWMRRPPNIFKPSVLKTLFGFKKDNYDILEELIQKLKTNTNQSIFFFLLNNKHKHDSNTDPNYPPLHQVIKKVSRYFDIGIHPSYQAFQNNTISAERKKLESISEKEIIYNRQHFLRIQFPAYFRTLNTLKIQKDFSLCYPDISGFRAGCSRPFLFYDIEQNTATELLLQPTCFMDATYAYYGDFNTDTIHQNLLIQINQVKKINGNLVTLFHNDLLAMKIYEQCFNFLLSDINNNDEI